MFPIDRLRMKKTDEDCKGSFKVTSQKQTDSSLTKKENKQTD